MVTLVLNSPYVDLDLVKTLGRTSMLIAVDGGLNHVYKAGIRPAWVVGDFDSLDPCLLDKLPGTRIMRFPKEKDCTDMELALRLAQVYRPRRINVLGLGGGDRLDHQLSNCIMLSALAKTGCVVQGWGGPQQMVFTSGAHILSVNNGRHFSVMALSGPAEVNIRGGKYSGTGLKLYPGLGLGLGNGIESRRAVVSVVHGVVSISQWKNKA